MDYMSAKEAAQKWGYAESTIRKWCKEGILFITYKAEKEGGRWKIPKDAECPKPIKKKEREKK